MYMFLSPDYSETVASTYSDFTTNTDRLTLDTEYTTIAAKVQLLDQPDEKVESYARIQFYQAYRNEGESEEHLVWVPSIRCNELYATEIASSKFYQTEFADDSWICPSIRNIEIYNNPFLFSSG